MSIKMLSTAVKNLKRAWMLLSQPATSNKMSPEHKAYQRSMKRRKELWKKFRNKGYYEE